jgi:hypothetical protein
MAQKIITVDDLDGESKAAETIRFSLNGAFYEIDLNAQNAERFKGLMKEFSDAGRKVEFDGRSREAKTPRVTQLPTVHPKRREGTRKGYERPARKWAQQNGIEVKPSGRLPQSIINDYIASTQPQAQQKAEA